MSEEGSSPVPESPGGSAESQGGRGGPMLALLARGLELWLRQQCQAIDELEIHLEGSAARLLGGRLEGVRLKARRVVFQSLEIEAVELRSAPMQVRMGALLRSKTLQLEQPFQISGRVRFSAEGLNRTLATAAWRQLGDGLAEELLGLAPLGGLRFDGDRLILSTMGPAGNAPIELGTRVEAGDGTVLLRTEPDGRIARLPMDPNVRIERVDLGGGRLELTGQALVSA